MSTSVDTQPRLSWPALFVGLSLMVGLSIDPRLLIDADGHADHLAAMFAGWAMAAGLVRGVGFVPAARPVRLLLSGGGAALAMVLLLLRIGLAHG